MWISQTLRRVSSFSRECFAAKIKANEIAEKLLKIAKLEDFLSKTALKKKIKCLLIMKIHFFFFFNQQSKPETMH